MTSKPPDCPSLYSAWHLQLANSPFPKSYFLKPSKQAMWTHNVYNHCHHSNKVSQALNFPPSFTYPHFIRAYSCSPSVTKLCPTLCDPMGCSMPGFPVLQYLLEFALTHVHWVYDAIQSSHPLSSPSPPACNLSQHGLIQWVGSPHEVAKVLEFQLQYRSSQWIFRVDFL